ncbi:MAG: hypothetical protein HQM14_08385 [SAR324 cluster bacterium]|nr:hypothetical protein [SAR324 cluster bacterium]
MSKVINLAQWKQQKESKQNADDPVFGFLIWLHCPTCQTIEYTEVRIQSGRVHKCGTLVEEVEVPIDIRAEYTISQKNLMILEKAFAENSGLKSKFKKLLGENKLIGEQLKKNEMEYQHRLALMTLKKIDPYPEDWDAKKNGIEFVTVQPSGIMITAARQADKYFPKKK